MNCDHEIVTHWLNNQLTAAEKEDFEQHLASCAECRQEVALSSKVMELMQETTVQAPSANMEARFQGMLDMYKASDISLLTRLQNLYKSLFYKPAYQLAYSCILLLTGVLTGYLLLNNSKKEKESKQELSAMNIQLQEMKQMMAVTLLQNPSASERLRAVSYTEEISQVNEQIIDALLTTLNEDPNVNVRLVTLDALSRYTNVAAVREGLVKSIPMQESPLVQLALADLMLRLHEKRSIESFKTLLQEQEVDTQVKNRLNQTIQKLIL